MYASAPPIVEQHARWRVPEDWQRRVKSIRADAWVIFNPNISRYAIVACDGSPRGVEVGGHRYAGVKWLMNVEHPGHGFRDIDDGVLAEFHERHMRGLRDAHRDRVRRSPTKRSVVRKHIDDAEAAKAAKQTKDVSDTTDAAISEVIEPAILGRRTLTAAGTIDYGDV